MRKGIGRGFKLGDDQTVGALLERPELPGWAGEWISEEEYRAGGYMPDFDSLPVMVRVVQRVGSAPVDIDDLPECDREFVRGKIKNAQRPQRRAPPGRRDR